MVESNLANALSVEEAGPTTSQLPHPPPVDTVEPSGLSATIPKTPGVEVDSMTSKRFIQSLSIIASLLPSIFLKL